MKTDSLNFGTALGLLARFFVTAGLSGFLLNIPHSIQIVMAQRLLPARKGFMGGFERLHDRMVQVF